MLVVPAAEAPSHHARDDMICRYFQSLAGVWELERNFSDGSHFAGQADFFDQGNDAFLLSENGTFRRPDGSAYTAGREWQWCLAGSDWLEIRYAEASGGALYHRLVLLREGAHLTGEAEHLCGEDRYCGRYRFSQDQIKVHQNVFGPKKNYKLTSAYMR